ncbi:hypothetical protein GCM10027058_12080 [Microbacterium neimengense]
MSGDIPYELGPAFRVGAARKLGVSEATLRAPDLLRPFHGVRAKERELPAQWRGGLLGVHEARHIGRALDFATQMGAHEFFTHATAAVLLGLPLPPRLVRDDEVHVGVLAPRRPPRGRGVAGHQAVPDLTSVIQHRETGLRLTSPATTWAMLAASLRHPYDVVAVGDAVLRDWRLEPLASISEMSRAADAGRRVGVARLREALPRLRARSGSRPETWLRLTIVDAGLPEPDLNVDVFVAGEYLACVDLAYPERRIAFEYEGEHHLRDPRQWASDIERYERLAAAGWLVIRATKQDVFEQPGRLMARVRRALASRG